MFLKLTLAGPALQRPGLELRLDEGLPVDVPCLVAVDNIDFITEVHFMTGPQLSTVVSKIYTKRGQAFNVKESVMDIALMAGYIESTRTKSKTAVMPPENPSGGLGRPPSPGSWSSI